MALAKSVASEGWIATPSRRAPAPRIAANRSPVAWLATIAAAGPSSSTKHNAVAYHGTLRDALVEPSSGSTTTIAAPLDPGPLVTPLSSESTR
jgi:hypothetical protein